MPQAAVPAIANSLLAATGAYSAAATAAAYTFATVAVYAAQAYALNAAATALAPDAEKAKGGADYGLNFSGTFEPRRLIYGEVWAGGMHTIPPISTNVDGKDFHFVLTIAGHETEGVLSVKFDDVLISTGNIGAITGADTDGVVNNGEFQNKAWIRRYNGTSTQTADYILTQADPTVFTSDFRGRGITYIACRLRYGDAYKGGVPNVVAQTRGKKLYDPRTLTTGPGTTSNPAIIIRDYLINHVGFAEAQIDDTLCAAAANICDQQVDIPGSTTQNRYTCNIMVDATEEWETVLASLVDTMRGRVVFRDGKWRIYAGAWEVPSIEITRKDWVGPTRVQASAPIEERWNAVRTWYVDASRNSQRVESFPRRNTVYETDDGDRIWKELDLPGCNNEFEAQRHGELCLRASRNQTKIVGRLRPEFAKLATWEPVSVTDEDYGWVSKTFRVFSMEATQSGDIEAVLVEEGSALWADLEVADYNNVTTVPTIDPSVSRPSPRTNFVALARNASIDFAWDPVTGLMPGEQTRLIEYANSGYAHLGTELWRGDSSRVNLAKADTTTRYYWIQGIVGSYTSEYTPNTFGYPQAALAAGAGAQGDPGADAIGVMLTLPAATLAANAGGTVADYAPANGRISVYQGALDVSSYATTRASSQAGVTGTVNSADNSPWSGQGKGRYRVTACTSDQGVLWCEAVYSGTTYLRPFVVSKARTGSAGADTIAGFLSNENVTLPASTNGYVADWSQAEGLFRMFAGVSSVSGLTTYSVESAAGCTAQINTADNSPVTGKLRSYYRVTAVTSDIGVAHFRAVYAGLAIDKQFTVSKVYEGVPGSASMTLALLASGQAFRFSGSGTNIGVNTLSFTAQLQNVGGTAGFKANNYAADGTLISSYALSGTGNGPRGLHINSFQQSGLTAYCTITASIAPGLWDQVTVNRVQEGAEGPEGPSGDDALSAYLTNEAHSLPSSSNGYVPAYTGAAGAMVLMVGASSVHINSATFLTNSNPQTLTHVFSANGTFAVTGGFDEGEDVGLLYLRGTYGGSTMEKVFTLTKARGGVEGINAPILDLISTGLQFRFSGSGTNIGVSTITFDALLRNLSGTAGFRASNYMQDGTPISSYALGGSGNTTRWVHIDSFSQAGSTAYTTVVTSLAGGYTDRATIVRVQEGATGPEGPSGDDALVAYLTNEAHTLPASSDGFVSDYNGAQGAMVLMLGVTSCHPNSVTFATNSNPQALTHVFSTNGTYKVTAGFGTAEEQALLYLRGTYGGSMLEKVFSLSKSRAGVDGGDGTAAGLLTLLASGQHFLFSGSGTNLGVSTIGFDIDLENVAGTAGVYANNFRSDATMIASYALSGSGNTGRGLHVNSFSQAGSTTWCTVVASIAGNYYDRVTVVRMMNGTPGSASLVSYLTNEVHTVPASSNGFVADYSGAEGTFVMALGASSVHPNSVAYAVNSNPQLLTNVFSTNGTYKVTAGMDVGESLALLYLRGTYGSATQEKVFTLAKATAGAPGADSRLFRLASDAQAFRISGSGTNVGVSTIAFDALLQNLSGTAGFYANNFRVGDTLISSYALGGSGNTGRSLHVNSFMQAGSTAYCTVVASLSGGYSDQITVVRIQEGAEGASGVTPLAAYLTNEAHTLPASTNGYVSDYTGADGRFVMMEGISSVSINSITYSTPANPQTLTHVFSTNGTYKVTGGFDVGEENASLTLRGTYKSTAIDKIFSLAKSKTGAAGGAGANALTAYLTNEAVVLPSSTNGYVPSYAGADGRFVVLLGIDEVNVGSITFSVNSNPQALTNVFSTNGTYKVTAGFGTTEDTAMLWLRAVYSGSALDRGFWLGKSKSGATGATGTTDTMRYIYAHSGSALYNGVGVVKLEAYALTGSGSYPITSGSAQLYIGSTIVSSANGFNASSGSNGFIAVLDATDIGSSKVVTLKSPGTTTIDSQSQVAVHYTEVNTGFGSTSGLDIDLSLTYPNVNDTLLLVGLLAEATLIDDAFTIHYGGVAGQKLGTTVAASGATDIGNRIFAWDDAMLSGLNKGDAYTLTSSNLLGQADVNNAAHILWLKNAYQGAAAQSYTWFDTEISSADSQISSVQVTIPTSAALLVTFMGWDDELGISPLALAGNTITTTYTAVHSTSTTVVGGQVAVSATSGVAGPWTLTSTTAGRPRHFTRTLVVPPKRYSVGGGDDTVYDTMTVLNVVAGEAQLLRLAATGQAFNFDATGASIGVSTIGFDAELSGLSGTAGFYANNYRADNTMIASYALGGSGNSNRSLRVTSFTQGGSTAYCTVVASISGGYSDQVTVVRLQDGTAGDDAYSTFLTNESHTLPASSNGFVPSYGGANGQMVVYRGGTALNALNVVAFSVSCNPQALTLSINNSGWYSATAGLDLGEDYAVAWLRAAVSGGPTLDKAFTLAKALGGLVGSMGPPSANLVPNGLLDTLDASGRFANFTGTYSVSPTGGITSGYAAAIGVNQYLYSGVLIPVDAWLEEYEISVQARAASGSPALYVGLACFDRYGNDIAYERGVGRNMLRVTSAHNPGATAICVTKPTSQHRTNWQGWYSSPTSYGRLVMPPGTDYSYMGDYENYALLYAPQVRKVSSVHTGISSYDVVHVTSGIDYVMTANQTVIGYGLIGSTFVYPWNGTPAAIYTGYSGVLRGFEAYFGSTNTRGLRAGTKYVSVRIFESGGTGLALVDDIVFTKRTVINGDEISSDPECRHSAAWLHPQQLAEYTAGISFVPNSGPGGGGYISMTSHATTQRIQTRPIT